MISFQQKTLVDTILNHHDMEEFFCPSRRWKKHLDHRSSTMKYLTCLRCFQSILIVNCLFVVNSNFSVKGKCVWYIYMICSKAVPTNGQAEFQEIMSRMIFCRLLWHFMKSYPDEVLKHRDFLLESVSCCNLSHGFYAVILISFKIYYLLYSFHETFCYSSE